MSAMSAYKSQQEAIEAIKRLRLQASASSNAPREQHCSPETESLLWDGFSVLIVMTDVIILLRITQTLTQNKLIETWFKNLRGFTYYHMVIPSEIRARIIKCVTKIYITNQGRIRIESKSDSSHRYVVNCFQLWRSYKDCFFGQWCSTTVFFYFSKKVAWKEEWDQALFLCVFKKTQGQPKKLKALFPQKTQPIGGYFRFYKKTSRNFQSKLRFFMGGHIF